MACSGLMVAAVFWYLYCQYHESFIKTWALTALGFALGPVFTLSYHFLPYNFGILGEAVAFLAASIFLLRGIYSFLNIRKHPQWVKFGCMLAGAGVLIGYGSGLPLSLYMFPAFALIAALFLQGGILLLRKWRITGNGGKMVGWALIIAGLNLMGYPFIRYNSQADSWGYLLAAICTVTVAIGILLLYFQKVRQDLTQSEARYRFMAENARDIVYHLQIFPVLKYEFISAAVTQVTGYTPEEYYRDPDLVYKVIYSADLAVMEQIVTGEFDYSNPVTLRWIHKNGDSFWIEQYINPVTDSNGKIFALEGIARNITERVRMEEQLKFLSMKDSTTGLYNRSFFEEAYRYFDAESHNPLGIILCDVDGLKLINDTLGHDAGDSLLLAATQAIRESFREKDVIARIGGDEFAVLLPKTPLALVEKSVQRIEAAVQRYNDSNTGIYLSLSVGFAFRADSGTSIADLFKTADNNMYREKLHRSLSTRSTIVNNLLKTLEARDLIAEEHTRRLQHLIIKFANTLGFAENRLANLKLLAQFHDIGKVGVPDRVLNKSGELTPEEELEMQRHCEIGYRIAKSSPDLITIADWVLRHHEWWNGNGYPLHLKGEEIPLECRILAIADAYDAMTNRKMLSPEEAIAELSKRAGVQFDPNLVAEFIQSISLS